MIDFSESKVNTFVCAVKARVDACEAFLDLPFVVHVAPRRPVVCTHVEPQGELDVGDVDVEGDCNAW